ncbi:MAG: hypothetical protein JNM22_18090 [Saprospiraceae bacterium]|nr:hypothetical protein [Saprospiraceae bacterium]
MKHDFVNAGKMESDFAGAVSGLQKNYWQCRSIASRKYASDGTSAGSRIASFPIT